MRVSLNPIWSKYAAEQMPAWLEWLRNISLKSYIELSQKFIDLNPYYAPQSDGSEAEDLFNRLIVNGDFFESVTDAGVRYWANSTFEEFIEVLDMYGERYIEIRQVARLFRYNISWFKRLYSFFRADLIMELREAGRIV
jgi:hypothetical protein